MRIINYELYKLLLCIVTPNIARVEYCSTGKLYSLKSTFLFSELNSKQSIHNVEYSSHIHFDQTDDITDIIHKIGTVPPYLYANIIMFVKYTISWYRPTNPVIPKCALDSVIVLHNHGP